MISSFRCFTVSEKVQHASNRKTDKSYAIAGKMLISFKTFPDLLFVISQGHVFKRYVSYPKCNELIMQCTYTVHTCFSPSAFACSALESATWTFSDSSCDGDASICATSRFRCVASVVRSVSACSSSDICLRSAVPKMNQFLRGVSSFNNLV